ncbi:MAG TPA: hypothetical protein VGX28_10145 [Frankiaceae bacterium]|nr:hypothetical protein [Frankiaceae bacterium]
MKNDRRLALRRETLTELTDSELTIAGGAAGVPSTDTKCDTNDYNWWLRGVTLDLTLHKDCSWSCI